MRWKMVFEQDGRSNCLVCHGSARYSASVCGLCKYWQRFVIVRSKRILGGNTEVIAFVLSVQLYILGRELFCIFGY